MLYILLIEIYDPDTVHDNEYDSNQIEHQIHHDEQICEHLVQEAGKEKTIIIKTIIIKLRFTFIYHIQITIRIMFTLYVILPTYYSHVKVV